MPYSIDDIPDQSGKKMITNYHSMTEASSGIGLESAKQLSAKGAHVIMACRNLSKSEAVSGSDQRDRGW